MTGDRKVRKARDTLERGYRIESERYPILERRASEASVKKSPIGEREREREREREEKS